MNKLLGIIVLGLLFCSNVNSKEVYLDCYWVLADGQTDSSLLVTINEKTKYLKVGLIGTFAITELKKNSITAISYATAFDQSMEILTASFDKYSGNLNIKGSKKAHKKFKCEKSIWSN